MQITSSLLSTSSSCRRIYGGFLATSHLPQTAPLPPPSPRRLQAKHPALVTPHARDVVNIWNLRRRHDVCCSHLQSSASEDEGELHEDIEFQGATEAQESMGVAIALSLLNFYRKEISPFLPRTCRYVPSCSEYSMQAYQRYGVTKGTILTAWRLIRCNPFGSSGFDPPRWFGESEAPID